MPAGTIALTNNSTTVTGTGTSFTTELKVNDFVTATVGGVLYTLGVAAIASNTSLTVIQKYDGPTASGLSWNPVPYGTMAAITAQLAAQVTYAIRGLNLDKNNWQGFYTATGNMTINLPDGNSVTGPSWPAMQKSISDGLVGKAASGSNNDITELKGLTTALSISQGGTGAKTKADAWTALATFGSVAGTAAQGNDSRLSTVGGKSGGNISSGVNVTDQVRTTSTGSSEVNRNGGLFTSDILVNAVSRGNFNLYMATSGSTRMAKLDVFSDGSNGKSFNFFQDSGSATCSGSWINSSDERHKSNIKVVENALVATLSWRGCTYDKKEGTPEVGLIAQDVESICPVAISSFGDRTFNDGEVIKDFKYLNTSGVSAAYHTEAIKSLFSLIELAIVDPEKALASIDAIKSELTNK